jgi:hypothetical protein
MHRNVFRRHVLSAISVLVGPTARGDRPTVAYRSQASKHLAQRHDRVTAFCVSHFSAVLAGVLLFLWSHAFLSLEQCSAQVRINETVQIQPKSNSSLSSHTLGLSGSERIATLTFSYFWRATAQATIEFWGPYGFYQSVSGPGVGQNGTSIQVVASPALPGTYTYKITPPNSADFCGEAFSITDDRGQIMAWDASGPDACQMYARTGNVQLSYANGFSINFTCDTLTSGQVQKFSIYTVSDTSGIRWTPPNITETMTIGTGAEFGQFYDASYHPIGLSVSSNSGDLSGVTYIANNVAEPGGTVQIEATYADKTKDISFFVKGQPPFIDGTLKFDIPDTIIAGTPVPFTLKAYGEGGLEFFPPRTDEAFIEILDHPEWAMFVGNDSLGDVEPDYVDATFGAYSQSAFALLGRADSGYTSHEYETVNFDFFGWGDYFWVEGEKQVVIHFAPENQCIAVSFADSNVSVGDTTLLVFKDENTGQPIPVDKVMDVWIATSDGSKGVLLKKDGAMTTTDSADTQPIRYIAPDSIDGESLKVTIIAVASIIPVSRYSAGTTNFPANISLKTSTENNKSIPASVNDTLHAGRLFKGPKGVMIKVVPPTGAITKVLQNGVCELGGGEVSNLQLVIIEHSPWTIWPYLPSTISKGLSRGAHVSGYDDQRQLEIHVTDKNGRPASFRSVAIKAAFIERSGGHDHNEVSYPFPSFSAEQGFFYSQSKHGNPIIGLLTGELGEINLNYTASQVSGSYLITASLIGNLSICDTILLNVQVPGLVDLGTSTYWKLKGTDSEYGKNHLSNHWCQPSMRDSLIAVIREFYSWSETDEGGGAPIVLGINDISIKWGGVFDIHGDWNEDHDHAFHRVGFSVDINQSPGDLREDNGSLKDNGLKLNWLMELAGAMKYPEKESIHFGFEGSK